MDDELLRPAIESNTRRSMLRPQVIRALFRKQLLLKSRDPLAFFEVFLASFLFTLIYPVFLAAQKHFGPQRLQPIDRYNATPVELATFFHVPGAKLLAMPENPNLKHLLNTLFAEILANTSVEIEFCKSWDDMKNLIDSSNSNAMGIVWVNSRDDKASRVPQFEIYTQDLYGHPSRDVMYLVSRYLTGMNIANDFGNPRLYRLLDFTATYQKFPLTDRYENMDIAFFIMFMLAVPGIIGVMYDFQIALEEKDSRVAAMLFLMGANESEYWFVSFVGSIVFGFIPYVVTCFGMCFWFYMTSTSYTLMLFVSLLFVIAHVLFLMFVSTFLKNASSGRSVSIILIVVSIFLCYVHGYYTLKPTNTNTFVKNMFSVLPVSCYQMVIGAIYNNCINNRPSITWTNMSFDMAYPVWLGILWLVIDALVYLALFVLCNAANAREFGIPPMPWERLLDQDSRFTVDETPQTWDPDSDVVIQVENLTKIYHGNVECLALENISFAVERGEVIVVIGPNGAGKSTLVNTLCGVIQASSGILECFGSRQTTDFTVIHKFIGVVFQSNVLVSKLSVRENLELFGNIRGISKSDIAESITLLTDQLQLTAMLDNYAGDLSGGQKRKLCIAIALLSQPPIVVMDEPTAGVDVQSRQLIWKTIADMKNTTWIVTTHALEEAEHVASRLFVIADHKIMYSGSASELRRDHKCGYVLRLEGPDTCLQQVIALAREYFDEQEIHEKDAMTIALPVNKRIADFLEALSLNEQAFGITSFSFAVEQLEDTLMKMLIA